MSNTTNTSGSGLGFFSLLTILFITLKLFNVTTVATWSWWWVLSPLWLPLVVILGVGAIIMGAVVIGGIIFSKK